MFGVWCNEYLRIARETSSLSLVIARREMGFRNLAGSNNIIFGTKNK